MTIQWSYFAGDVLTGQIIADLPLSGVRFTRALNGHGAMTGSLTLSGLPALRRYDLVDAIDPGRRALYAEADGVLQWGGIIWSEGDDNPVNIQAQEFGSYFGSVVLRRPRAYTAVDQLEIARDLLRTHQAEAGGNVRVALGSETSGVLRDRSYLPGDMPVVGELFTNLANVENGFDFSWPAEYGPDGLPRARLMLGYPRLGSTEPAIVVDMPRAIGFTRDASALAVTSWATGAKPVDGSDVPVASSTDPALSDAGYPLLDKVHSYTDVIDPTTLQAHADADQTAAGGTLATVKVTVSIAQVLSNGVQPGDPALCMFTGPRFPAPDDREPTPAGEAVIVTTITDDVYGDLYGDLYAGALVTTTTPGTPGLPGGSRGAGFAAVLRVTAIDYDPPGGTCELTLAPRITFGGKVPTARDDAATNARLTRELRLLSTST